MSAPKVDLWSVLRNISRRNGGETDFASDCTLNNVSMSLPPFLVGSAAGLDVAFSYPAMELVAI